MDRVRRHVRRRHAPNGEGIALHAIGQCPETDVGASLRRVLVTHECRERRIRGQHAVANRCQQRGTKSGLIGRAHPVGKPGNRDGEWRRVRRLSSDRPGLRRDLGEENLRRHDARRHSILHLRGHLIEQPRHLPQARDVVLVILRRREREPGHELGQVDVHAHELRHGHLPFLELGALEQLPEVSHHEVAIQPILCGEPDRLHFLEALEEVALLHEIAIDRGLGEVAQAIIVSLVAEDRCEFG